MQSNQIKHIKKTIAKDFVIVEVNRETRTMIKKLAALEEKTIPSYLASIIQRAYEPIQSKLAR